MKNRWSDAEARKFAAEYERDGINEDIALRVYTSRLIGGEPELVIHGGGNTSVKTRLADFLGDETDAICVKGSGWDLADIAPPGLPALHLEPLRRVRNWEALSDEDMVAFLRLNLLDPSSPNPSVETLLHAFLPHKYVDHSHASAILALSDQADGMGICRKIFGDRIAIVPYVMAGFQLAKETAGAFENNRDVDGVLLHKHGLFTFGDTARQSYDRMIALVSLAEDAIDKTPAWAPALIDTSKAARADQIAPIIRGACSSDLGEGRHLRLVADLRSSPKVRSFVDTVELETFGARGVVTPDHIIRTKNNALIAPFPDSAELDAFRGQITEKAAEFRSRYEDYFHNNNERAANAKTMLDTGPRVVLVPGIGLFGLGMTSKHAKAAADLAEITIDTVIKAERIGRFEPLGDADLFDMEYWSLEQAKLGKAQPKALEGQIAVITGGGGTIGAATAKLFAQNGAEIALLDINEEACAAAADEIGPRALAIQCDLTDRSSVEDAYRRVCLAFGGVDILVSNAGAAWESPIDEMDDALLRKSFELNFFAHQNAAQQAVRVMKAQGTGGALLFNVSKQAVNPGVGFGAYGLPKAATLLLMRQYALEFGRYGIRANAVNADRIRSGLLNDDMIGARARARKLDKKDYLRSNLLELEVRASDVAQAFLHHALALKTTGDITTVDGGNVAAMLR
jgi:rhamnose utilization protein RhaD (predicted bifunctional aldolase and dehydrogenase)/NAD(P)-dependent dehydrogenase (short-subunit alcohol dehydrogenase family)